mmetsp:Transcript_15573/g.49233  ORF Transcript_15573/g.49233 Transcript_15573/m.49233 type:complete len:233 (+) Transcript_15573:241-939(+)
MDQERLQPSLEGGADAGPEGRTSSQGPRRPGGLPAGNMLLALPCTWPEACSGDAQAQAPILLRRAADRALSWCWRDRADLCTEDGVLQPDVGDRLCHRQAGSHCLRLRIDQQVGPHHPELCGRSLPQVPEPARRVGARQGDAGCASGDDLPHEVGRDRREADDRANGRGRRHFGAAARRLPRAGGPHDPVHRLAGRTGHEPAAGLPAAARGDLAGRLVVDHDLQTSSLSPYF